MKNMNETGNFDMLKNPEIVNAISRVVNKIIDEKITEMMKTGLSEIEAISLLRGVPAAGV